MTELHILFKIVSRVRFPCRRLELLSFLHPSGHLGFTNYGCICMLPRDSEICAKVPKSNLPNKTNNVKTEPCLHIL